MNPNFLRQYQQTNDDSYFTQNPTRKNFLKKSIKLIFCNRQCICSYILFACGVTALTYGINNHNNLPGISKYDSQICYNLPETCDEIRLGYNITCPSICNDTKEFQQIECYEFIKDNRTNCNVFSSFQNCFRFALRHVRQSCKKVNEQERKRDLQKDSIGLFLLAGCLFIFPVISFIISMYLVYKAYKRRSSFYEEITLEVA